MDLTVQAASGVMSVTGFADNDPVKAGPAIADFLSGIHLYAGVMTALYERTFSGHGRLVEVAMQETLYPTLASNLGMMYDNGTVPPRTGNRHGGLSVSPYNVYSASDGHFAVIVLNDQHWTRLARAMARPELATDPRFATGVKRVEHIDIVDDMIAGWGRGLGRDEALALLREHAVPSAPVRDLIEVTNDPHMHARGMLTWLEHSEFGRIAIPDSPIRLHGARRLPLMESPRLGADNFAVLSHELGLSLAEIEELQARGILGCPALVGAGND
jgi:crotonobetainyl-CoA:carnitine CoA-transferase CaiB-like acyl-CoA transferase